MQLNQQIPLQIFNCYRLLLASILVFFFFVDFMPVYFGYWDPLLFEASLYIYWFIAILFLIGTFFHKQPSKTFILATLLFDLIILLTFIHTSGGITSRFGILMIGVVAGSAVLIPGATVYGIALLSALSLFSMQLYTDITYPWLQTDYVQTGIVSLAMMLVAFLVHQLSLVALRNESRATSLAKLNAHTISLIPTGIIIFDEQHEALLVNQAARTLLGLSAQAPETQLPEHLLHSIKQSPCGFVANLHLRYETERLEGYYIALLYKLEHEEEEARRKRLVDLGFLASNIAHEIRNPLSAILHAQQLLAEEPALSEEATSLIEIIEKNGKRTNQIITNILRLSNQKPPERNPLKLSRFLAQVPEALPEARFNISNTCQTDSFQSDAAYLQHILSILLDNAVKHGGDSVCLQVHELPEGLAFDVLDAGPGIPEEIQPLIFDPFFTRSASGTGLGLYLAKSFSEALGAQLFYLHRPAQKGALFRLLLPMET